MIKVNELRKQYATHEAVKGISFSVAQGELFAFLGTNGAGKTTTMNMLCTLLDATSGTVTINGHLLGTQQGNDHIRRSIGVVFQQNVLDARLTVEENIRARAATYHLSKDTYMKNYAFVREYLQLADIEKRYYGTLSGGQKRRADIARALIHRPHILFLDEPTTGLDPKTRQFVWQTIKRLREETNMTVFLTTHYMEEAAVADTVIILKDGRIVAEGTPHTLKMMHAYDVLTLVFTDVMHGEQWLRDRQIAYDEKQGVYTVAVTSPLEALQLLKQAEPFLASFEVVKGTMDDVFLHVTNEEVVSV
ncbi:ABC transporter ATP-binding protein [Caryophanon tenue]|uniref:ABC transporter n=1 Tax=Caryophanon tenue TaxID=33978 RepID=A0A1C0YHK4_9BACL|nr:ABC transporter ATP-binding protein [Caryophanon tenue]OCS86668.1 ABC transporter [Caryophanon tenue]